ARLPPEVEQVFSRDGHATDRNRHSLTVMADWLLHSPLRCPMAPGLYWPAEHYPSAESRCRYRSAPRLAGLNHPSRSAPAVSACSACHLHLTDGPAGISAPPSR